MEILFHEADFQFELPQVKTCKRWLEAVAEQESKPVEALNYIFCSDAYLHDVNLKYLNHDTLTDIITFPLSEEGEAIESDIFISIERVRENAQLFNVRFQQELYRVIVHGLLHLLGYKDKTEAEVKEMRAKENFYLRRLTEFTNTVQ